MGGGRCGCCLLIQCWHHLSWFSWLPCNIPSRGEDQEISKGSCGISRRGGKNAENGRVDMVHGDGAHVDKLGQVVLVGYIVAMPGDDIERRVGLLAHEELATQLVNDLPRLFLNLVLGYGMQEVTGVGEAVRTQGAELRELEIGAPDFYIESALHRGA